MGTKAARREQRPRVIGATVAVLAVSAVFVVQGHANPPTDAPATPLAPVSVATASPVAVASPFDPAPRFQTESSPSPSATPVPSQSATSEPVGPSPSDTTTAAPQSEPAPSRSTGLVDGVLGTVGEVAGGVVDGVGDLLQPRWERIGQEALDYLGFSPAGWEVVFEPGKPGELGRYWPSTRRIVVWVRSTHDVMDVAGTLAHEFGHALDADLLNGELRDEWRAMRGIDAAYWPDCACDDRNYGAGDLAESVVAMLVPGETRVVFGDPTPDQRSWLRSHLGF